MGQERSLVASLENARGVIEEYILEGDLDVVRRTIAGEFRAGDYAAALRKGLAPYAKAVAEHIVSVLCDEITRCQVQEATPVPASVVFSEEKEEKELNAPPHKVSGRKVKNDIG